MQPTSTPSGERWNVNMPAVIGVVFVFLVGVVIWVVVSSGDGDDAGSVVDPDDSQVATSPPPTSDGLATTTAPNAPTTPPPSATAATSTAPTTASSSTTTPTTAPTTPPTTTPPVTAAPDAGDDTVPGDLGVAGRAMQRPPCDGSYITVLASAVGDQATAEGVAAVLEQYSGSNYLRTDQSCPSLSPSAGGEPIYVVFFGPFAFDTDACTARADGPDDAYARQLSDDVGPDHSVTCG